MNNALYRIAQYVSALQSLLPRGAAWPRDDDAVLSQVINGLAPVFNRTDLASQNLLDDAFPGTADDFIPEWQSTLDFSAIFGTGGFTQAQKDAQIVATLADSGGQSIAYYQAYAKLLGYDITIWCGDTGYSVDSGVDQPMISSTSPNTFQVNVAAGTDTTVLAAMMYAFKPAHTVYYFNFI
jgi:uncharacterized protein YmfQ (DUF2313 family)